MARGVDGVQTVQNDIAVKKENSSTGEVIDDSLLTAKVKTALIENSDTKAHQINVETKQGVVQLSGFVDSAAARNAATSVARSVTGVKDVKNELSVKQRPPSYTRYSSLDVLIRARVGRRGPTFLAAVQATSPLLWRGVIRLPVRKGTVPFRF